MKKVVQAPRPRVNRQHWYGVSMPCIAGEALVKGTVVAISNGKVVKAAPTAFPFGVTDGPAAGDGSEVTVNTFALSEVVGVNKSGGALAMGAVVAAVATTTNGFTNAANGNYVSGIVWQGGANDAEITVLTVPTFKF